MSIVTRVLASGAQKILLAAIAGLAMSAAANAATNLAPKISGTPATTATVGTLYSFKPTASDPEGKYVSFGIRNQPSWASFDRRTGQLQGTPKATGTFSGIQIYAWDGVKAGALPRFSITVKAAGSTVSNTAPKISGTPLTAVNAGNAYSFTPTASDANGDTLAFSILNKPVWASFSTVSGKLSGTPSAAQVGSYANIVISVSDGKVKTSLAAFAINVTATSAGAATLSWVAPTSNIDGSALTNLSGYRIYYGTSSGALTQTIQVNNASVSTYVVENLSPATYYFAVKAITSAGAESGLSNIASRAVN